MNTTDYKVLRGGLVLDPLSTRAESLDVLIGGDRIVEVGPAGMDAPADAVAMDVAGKLLIPGLVNAHTHGHGSFAKGLVDDRWNLELFLNNGPWLSGRRSTEDKCLAAKLGAVEMVRKGCTACYDLYFEFPIPTAEGIAAVGEAYREVGMRAVVAPMVADHSLYQALPGLLDVIPPHLRPLTERFMLAPCEVTIGQMRAIFRDWPFDRAQIAPAIAPTIPLHCSDAFLGACGDLAVENGLPLQTHLAESRTQAVLGLKKYGCSLTAHLHRLGLLTEDFSAAHGIWLDDADLALLADAGAAVVHNPQSNMRVGSGLARLRPMVSRGITVGIGTDTSCASDAMNMFEAMRLAAFISRIQDGDSITWLTAANVLSMATVGSAKTLGFGDGIGRLAPGFKADIVMLDLAHINYMPFNDAVRQVVYCENGAAVHTVLVGGRVVLSEGRLLTVDEAKLRADVEAALARLLPLNAETRAVSEQLDSVIGTFCRAMLQEPLHLDRLARA